MSEVKLESAVLLCNSRRGESGAHDLVVNGLMLPGSRPMYHHNPFGNLQQAQEFDLLWPAEMLDELGGYYDRYFARPNNRHFNCHTFGAIVTGQEADMQLSRSMEPEGVNRQKVSDPNDLQNTQLYGVFRWGRPIHSLVGIQHPDMCIGVTGYRNRLSVSHIDEMLKDYPGKLYRYEYEEMSEDPIAYAGAIVRKFAALY